MRLQTGEWEMTTGLRAEKVEQKAKVAIYTTIFHVEP
jgi:hypothetical protein